MTRRVVLLGSTGSVGRQALQVMEHLAGRVRPVVLVAGRDAAALREQALHWRPEAVALADAEGARWLESQLAATGIRVLAGESGVCEAARWPAADMALAAIAGTAGLPPVLAAIEAGKDLALANKEALVVAGELVMAAVRDRGVRLVPVDSEHNAIFQCLEGHPAAVPRRLILTASGGPFLGLSQEELAHVGVRDALAHPTWRMGPQITVDSATLMNKGLEVIEAHWLFGVPVEQIEVVVHRQSIVHSLVELVDGAVFALLGPPDMRLPLQYALTYPERVAAPGDVRPLDLADLGRLDFVRPDMERFPALALGYRAARAGGTLPAVMSAAREVAVAAFLAGDLPFLEIPEIIARVMDDHKPCPAGSLEAVLAADAWARQRAHQVLPGGVG